MVRHITVQFGATLRGIYLTDRLQCDVQANLDSESKPVLNRFRNVGVKVLGISKSFDESINWIRIRMDRDS